MTLISPVTFVGGFVNGMGRLPCTPLELQEAPSTTQDAAAILTIIAFILWHGSPTFLVSISNQLSALDPLTGVLEWTHARYS